MGCFLIPNSPNLAKLTNKAIKTCTDLDLLKINTIEIEIEGYLNLKLMSFLYISHLNLCVDLQIQGFSFLIKNV